MIDLEQLATLPSARSFAHQLRYAADDRDTPVDTMRQAMHDAAGVIDSHFDLITLQQQWINQQRLHFGAAVGLLITTWLVGVIVIVARFI
jgi:hypothetical protein